MAAQENIRAWLSSDDLAPLELQLPPAGPEAPRTWTGEIQHADYGPIRVTFELYRYKHYRNHFWKWAAAHAVQLDTTKPKPGYWLKKVETDWRGVPREPLP